VKAEGPGEGRVRRGVIGFACVSCMCACVGLIHGDVRTDMRTRSPRPLDVLGISLRFNERHSRIAA
jgi:hypothetical protein